VDHFYLFLGVEARVILVALVACGAVCHAAKALGGESQLLMFLPDRLPLCWFSSSSLELDQE
jgi:hypothetical protein